MLRRGARAVSNVRTVAFIQGVSTKPSSPWCKMSSAAASAEKKSTIYRVEDVLSPPSEAAKAIEKVKEGLVPKKLIFNQKLLLNSLSIIVFFSCSVGIFAEEFRHHLWNDDCVGHGKRKDHEKIQRHTNRERHWLSEWRTKWTNPCRLRPDRGGQGLRKWRSNRRLKSWVFYSFKKVVDAVFVHRHVLNTRTLHHIWFGYFDRMSF